jgi:class 3 adenylate cyclase
VKTVRKKLTIFFSDIKDFTTSSERLQPEELTTILNEYFTEMSSIALAHGGTIDKFVGDAILIFFGDPESRGEAEDARACLRMAIDMQQKLGELGLRWRRRGIEEPFRVRMGINTGFCNVGNFGSAERIDYTIIGAEANLAARLQSIAEPGRIVISYETFALVRDIVRAHALEPIHVKGISREVTPYLVDGLTDESAARNVFREHESGLELFLDINDLDAAGLARTKTILAEALAAVNRKSDG